jgi:glycosyltransferase involved in cell wall biosynthesis
LKDYDYEHVFADNYSNDRTVEILRRLADKDKRIKVILNARNFGPMRSPFNALMATTGDAAVPLLAADLQDPPDLIVDFVRQWEQGFDVVQGLRESRDEGAVMVAVRRFYYKLVANFSSVDIPPNVGEFQLIDRKVINELEKFDDRYPYTRGLIARCGFSSTGIPYKVRSRERGVTKNRMWNLIDQGLNGIVSTSNVPLRFSMLAGLTIAVLAILVSIAEFFVNLIFFREFTASGIGLLTTALFFFSGVQLFFIGVLGEYIGSIHTQVRGGPVVIERERINFDEE